MKNYYDLLGVNRSMTCEEIEAQFVGKINTLGVKEQRALSVLTNAKTRQAYDQMYYETVDAQTLGEEVRNFYHDEKQKDYEEFFAQEEVVSEIENNEKQCELNQLLSIEDVNDDEIEIVSDDETINPGEVIGLTDDEIHATVIIPATSKEKFYKTLGGRIAIVASAAVLLIGACLLIKPKSDSKNSTNGTNVTATPTPGFKPEQQPEVTPTPEVQPEQQPEVTPTPEVQPEQEPEVEEVVINPEEVTEINSENIDIMANYYAEQAALKGLEVNNEVVRSALVLANKDSISKEELEKMVPSLDLIAEYKKANDYLSAVNSHNIVNAIYGKDMTKYVSISNLSYSNDSHIVQSLEAYNVYLIECMNRGYLTEDEYNTTFRLITRFYEEKSGLAVGDFEYNYEDLTAGGKYLAEVAIWPNFSVAFTLSDYATEDTLADIKSMERVTIDGARWLNELTSCGNVKTR